MIDLNMVTNVYSLKDNELKQVLLAWGLSLSGKKADKLARIVEALKDREHNPEEFDLACFLATGQHDGDNPSELGGQGDMHGGDAVMLGAAGENSLVEGGELANRDMLGLTTGVEESNDGPGVRNMRGEAGEAV